MIKEVKRGGRRSIRKGLLTVALMITLLTGSCMSALAGWFWGDQTTGGVRYQEDDGSFPENKWVQLTDPVNRGRWVYVGPGGYVVTDTCAAPCAVLPNGSGGYMTDQRVCGAAIAAEGQEPVFGVPGIQKDIQYKGLRQTLDALPLYPDTTTGTPELDAVLDQIFAQIITPDMDTHDKLRACYDYLVMNTYDPRYEGGEFPAGCETPVTDIFSTYYDAAFLFCSGTGVCDNFSAAFAVMAWKIGVPMYIVGGETSSSRGGYTPHAWCQLDGADGTVYIFDPHIDYLTALRSGKASSYARFGVPAAKMAGKYTGITRIFDKVK